MASPLSAFFLAVATAFISVNAYAFAPCDKMMPQGVSFLPAVKVCGGKAAIVLSGKYINSFSAVVRSCQNGDRDPCYSDTNSCGTNASSPFKAQSTIKARIRSINGKVGGATIHCLKESGYSQIYKMVRRMTIKRVNPVRNPATDLLRICLPSRTTATNPVQIIAAGEPKGVGNIGFNSACITQRYLGCNIEAAIAMKCSF